MLRIRRVMLLCLIITAGAGTAWCQFENIWAWGIYGGMDFNSGSPVRIPTSVYTSEASASVCDKDGQLLFYTDGTYVYNRNHDMMPNGSYIQPYGFPHATASTTQGAVIVQRPGSDTEYFVFSLTAQELTASAAGQLFVSRVDMSLHNGLGDVDPGYKMQLVNGSKKLLEGMVTVPGDDCNIWVLVADIQAGQLLAYNVTPAGLDAHPVISALPGIVEPEHLWDKYPGHMAISSNRNLLSVVRQSGRHALYRFDSVSGVASDAKLLNERVTGAGLAYASYFSPDNSKLYASFYNGGLRQYDVSVYEVPAILASAVQLSSYWSCGMKLGPDGKIYVIGGNSVLHTIDAPDLPGLACGFRERAIEPALFRPLPPSITFNGIFNLPSDLSFAKLRIDDTLETSAVVSVCFSDSSLLYPVQEGVSSCVWNTGATSGYIAADTPGLYWVRYVKDCTVYTDTFRVQLFSPRIHVRGNCRDIPGQAWVSVPPGTEPPYSLRWKDSSGNTVSRSDTLRNVPRGEYSVQIVSASGCDSILHFTLDDISGRVSFELSDTLICAEEAVMIRNTSPSYYDALSWYVNGVPAGSDTLWEHLFAEAGIHTVSLAASGQVCRDTFTRRVTADAPAGAIRFLKEKDEVCAGSPVVLMPDADGSILSLSWDFGDGSVYAAAAETVTHHYNAAGIKHITMEAAFRACPPLRFTDSLKVHPNPEVDLGNDTFYCRYDDPVTLYNRYQDGEAETWQWSTGAATAAISVSEAGRYMLTVRNAAGCTGTDTIEIGRDCHTAIPNVFTPDGDGYNDYFFPVQLLSRGAASFHLQVFSRWGQKVYESRDLNGRGWNGTLNGTPQAPGVYIYQISVVYHNGNRETFQGNVTLLR